MNDINLLRPRTTLVADDVSMATAITAEKCVAKISTTDSHALRRSVMLYAGKRGMNYICCELWSLLSRS